MSTDVDHARDPSYGDLSIFLRRGFAFALVVAVAAAVTTYVLSDRLTPTYAARATLLVAQPNPEVRALAGGVVTPSEVDVSVYQAAATTDTVLLGALERIGNPEPTRQELQAFERRLDVGFDETRISSLLHVTVRAHDAAVAADEANALAASLIAWDGRRAVASVQRVIETLEAQIRGLAEQIAALRSAGAPSAEIDERLALHETQRSQLALARALQTRTIGLLEPFETARPPLEPISPRVVRDTVLAALAGIVLAYALLLIRGAGDARFRTVDDFARGTGLRVLAEFPPERRGSRRLPREATSYLRTNLQLTAATDGPLVVTVTAPDRATGTFGVSLSLAESFARNGQRTLLIDSDLRKAMPRRGSVADFADVGGSQPSLREYLEHPTASFHPTTLDVGADARLDLIASFEPAPYPSELLSRSFGHLLDRLREHYEVIVVDTAPALAVADSLVVARYATGIVLVASLPHVTRSQAQQTLELLAPVDARVLGAVVTNVDAARARVPAMTAAEEPVEPGKPRGRSTAVRQRSKAPLQPR